MQKLFTALVFALALSSAPASAAGKVEIHYIPFNLATYHAVTPEGIARVASYIIEVEPSDARLQELADILENAPSGPPLEEWFVRARIRFPSGRVLYLDKTGGIRRPEGDADLDEEAFARVTTLMTALTGAPLAGPVFPGALDLAEAYTSGRENRTGNRFDAGIISFGVDEESGFYIVRITNWERRKWIDLYFDPDTKALVREIAQP